MAGTVPSPMTVGEPPATGTDSIWPRQPCRTEKYTVLWSGDTEISSALTPPGTSVLITWPCREPRRTSAPALVTATMPGGLAFFGDGALADADPLLPAGDGLPLPCALPPLPPPHAASMVSAVAAAVTASILVARGRWDMGPHSGVSQGATGEPRPAPGPDQMLIVAALPRDSKLLPRLADRGGHPAHGLGQKRLRGADVQPGEAAARGAEAGPWGQRDPAPFQEAGRRVVPVAQGTAQLAAVQPGQEAGLGRPVADLRQVLVQQLGQQAAVAVQLREDRVQPSGCLLERGDRGVHAEQPWQQDIPAHGQFSGQFRGARDGQAALQPG